MARNLSLDLDSLQATLERVQAGWEMTFTTMTALVEDERERRLGVPPPPGRSIASLEDEVPAAAAAAAGASATAVGAAPRFDVRDVDGVSYDSPVKDQADCGSCVAFGTVGAMEVTYRRTKRSPDPIDLSEAHLFYCHGRDAGRTCDSGWLPEGALAAARSTGVTTEDKYPYTPGDQECTGLSPDWGSTLAKVTAFQMITGNAASMKREIFTRGAVVACMNVYQDLFSYGGGVYTHVTGEYAGGHCVLLIGYDDVDRYWIGRNSWGTGWGDGGYFKIAYGQCLIEGYQTAAVTGVTLTGSPTPPAPPYPGRLLKHPPMTVGEDVRAWQQRMTELGFALTVDGKYGPGSKKACIELQRARGIGADGIVGRLTWQATFA